MREIDRIGMKTAESEAKRKQAKKERNRMILDEMFNVVKKSAGDAAFDVLKWFTVITTIIILFSCLSRN